MSATQPDYRPCVGIMLADARGRVFAGERLDTPGAWQMPQGGIDPGESPRTAALRELEEEIGLRPDSVRIEAETPDWLTYDLPPELQGRMWGGRWCGQRQRWFLMRLTGRDEDIDLDTAHPEFGRWRWMEPEALVAQIVPFKREIYRAVLAAFRDRL